MKWKKLGLIFSATNNFDWMHTHSAIPIAEQLDIHRFRVYFSSRDKLNRAHTGYLELDMRAPLNILYLHDTPVFEPGELGCFDDSGVLPTSMVMVNGIRRIYYSGINLDKTVTFRSAIGVAKWNDLRKKFIRLYDGPVLDRSKNFPHLVASPGVIWDSGKFKMWFTAGVRWEKLDEKVKHYYRLEYAESADGIDWVRDGRVAIDFRDMYEYAIGVPRVIKDGNIWRMWFCARATAQTADYRICYAESEDGIKWNRKDHEVGINVSPKGWDSQMICYPYVFDYKENRYMLYSGNGYGKSGFGIAVLEND